MRDYVLLVEDDPSVARFVSMALEPLPIELLVCPRVADALDTLRSQPVRLVITDLMLPGESGLSLLQALHDQPALRQGARLVAFSAGVNTDVRQQLNALDVWRVLSKPASVATLEACVCEALGLAVGVSPTPESAGELVTAAERLAIDAHFAGDAALFLSYRASCRQQFLHDLRAGDAALQAQDAPALRRLAHSLATVLQTLGLAEAGLDARALEHAAERSEYEIMAPIWARLRPTLSAPSSR